MHSFLKLFSKSVLAISCLVVFLFSCTVDNPKSFRSKGQENGGKNDETPNSPNGSNNDAKPDENIPPYVPGNVLTAANFKFIGGFRMPDSIPNKPLSENTSYTTTAYNFPAFTMRRVGQELRFFSTTHVYGGAMVYEVTKPDTLGEGLDFSKWPVAKVYKGWGNIYDTYTIRTRNIKAATTSTATLSENSGWEDNAFKGWYIDILTGTGSAQTRKISSYVGATRQANLNAAWNTVPDTSSTYFLYQGTARAADTSTLTLEADDAATAADYFMKLVFIVDGTGKGQKKFIQQYDPTSKVVTIQGTWTTLPATDSKYVIFSGHRYLSEGSAWTSGIGNGNELNGLHWDESTKRLYWNYGHWYSGNGDVPSFGFSTLDDHTTTALRFGPWRIASHCDKFSRGGTLIIPKDFANMYTGGKTLAVGFGGYYSIFANGSNGPSLGAIETPPAVRNIPATVNYSNTGFPKLNDIRLVGHPTPGTYPNPPFAARRPPNYENRDPHGQYWEGPIASATDSTFTFAAGGISWRESTAANGWGLKDHTIEIISGTGVGQLRHITSSDYQTRIVSISPNWTTIPDSTSIYRIYGGTAQGGSATTIILKPEAMKTGYAKYFEILGGTGAGQSDRYCTSYDAATKTCTVTPAWTTPPDATSQYYFYDSGFGGGVSNPIGDRGFWTWSDSVGGATWIKKGAREGVIFFTQLGTGFLYYEASNLYTSGGKKSYWHIYQPEELGKVANGTLKQYEVNPSSIILAPEYGSRGFRSAGVYDPVEGYLYVQTIDAYKSGSEYKPVIHVYQVIE